MSESWQDFFYRLTGKAPAWYGIQTEDQAHAFMDQVHQIEQGQKSGLLSPQGSSPAQTQPAPKAPGTEMPQADAGNQNQLQILQQNAQKLGIDTSKPGWNYLGNFTGDQRAQLGLTAPQFDTGPTNGGVMDRRDKTLFPTNINYNPDAGVATNVPDGGVGGASGLLARPMTNQV
jgi:hypothetical protein